MADIAWVGLDWGTTNLRAFAINCAGDLAGELTSENGMGKLEPHEFEPALLDLIAPWLDGRSNGESRVLPVFACGMVGARRGWREASYQETPCPPVSSDGVMVVPTEDKRIKMHILPGLSQRNPSDVMRGEETQVAGLLLESPGYTGAVCLPGTHSKWVSIENGEVAEFTTYMTGEMFDVLSRQSVLKHTVISDGWDDAAFENAIQEAALQPQKVFEALFRVRADALLLGAKPDACRARLSGLLIGQELGLAARYWSGRPVALIGSASNASRYKQALESLNVEAKTIDARAATLAGLSIVASKKGAVSYV